MVNKALTGTVVAASIALILMLTAFIVPQWQNKTYTSDPNNNGQVSTTQYIVGLSTWIYEYSVINSDGSTASSDRYTGPLAEDGDIDQTSTFGGSTSTTTLVPPDSTNKYKSLGVVSIIDNSRSARNGTIGTGVPAFIFGIIFLGLLAAAQLGKGFHWFKPLSVFLCVLTAVMTFVGVFLYAKALDIGYSFIIWAGFAVFALLGGIFVIIPTTGTKGGRYFPAICMTVALILGVAGLATTSWYSETNDARPSGPVYTGNAGVKAYSVLYETYDSTGTTLQSTTSITSSFGSDTFEYKYSASGSSQDVTVTKCPDTPSLNACYAATAYETTRFKPFIPAGQKALGCGIPALAFGVVALVAMVLLLRGNPFKYAKMMGIGCSFLCSALAFLGLFLYAAVTSVGASFIVYAAAGFMWVLASCMAFSLLDDGGSGGSASSKPAPTDQTTSPSPA